MGRGSGYLEQNRAEASGRGPIEEKSYAVLEQPGPHFEGNTHLGIALDHFQMQLYKNKDVSFPYDWTLECDRWCRIWRNAWGDSGGLSAQQAEGADV